MKAARQTGGNDQVPAPTAIVLARIPVTGPRYGSSLQLQRETVRNDLEF